MQAGVVFPQTEIPTDPSLIRGYAKTIEDLSFDYLLAYDHVVGANPDREGGWRGPYTYEDTFHEPFVLFSHLAALTQRLEFATGILILPQRQTALVAKQAAQLDLLSEGRLRLGVGVGWNDLEFEALGQDFSTRGKRSEEQVILLKKLWQERLITFDGEFHTFDDIGIHPLPTREIPIWFGGGADAVMRRMAKHGAGWMPNSMSPEKLKPRIETLRGYIEEEGRNPDDFGIDIRISSSRKSSEHWAELIEAFRELGATHIAINTMGNGYTEIQEHMNDIRTFKEIFDQTV